jgi:hypothetical protein
MPAGYSETPLTKKLGLKPGTSLFLINPPPDYASFFEQSVDEFLCTHAQPSIVHLFAKNNSEFEKAMKKLIPVIAKNKNISIWVSWYKKSSGITTDLTEDIIRNYALANGLVDVKVCAVSKLWSGLKLVVPLKKRG